MSQLRTHQRAYREHEWKHISAQLIKAKTALKDLYDDPPDDTELMAKIEANIRAEITRCEELLPQLERRVARLR